MTKRPIKMNLLDTIQTKLMTSLTAPLESTLAVRDELIQGTQGKKYAIAVKTWPPALRTQPRFAG